MTRLNEERLAELARLDKAATAGPWERENPCPPDCKYCNDEDPHGGQDFINSPSAEGFRESIIECDSGIYGPKRDDADLICAMRNALPALLAEVRELRATVERKDALLHEARNSIKAWRGDCAGCGRDPSPCLLCCLHVELDAKP